MNQIDWLYPILKEVWKLYGDQFLLWSHESFKYDDTLSGIPDYILAKRLQASNYLYEHGLIPNMLSKSRFNRRLHKIAELMYDLQQQLGMMLPTCQSLN